jgi:hypothetical protein
MVDLLVLDATTASTLGGLDALLVRLDLTTLHGAHDAASRLPRPGKVAGSGLTEEVNLDEVALESALERNDRLDKQRVGVLHVQVHEAHHADTHHLGLEEGAQLLQVVGLDRGRDKLGLLARAHGRRLDVLNDGHV